MAEIKIRGDISGSTTIKAPDSGSDEVIELSTALAAKAPLASPTFTGTVALPSGTTLDGSALTSGKILQVVRATDTTNRSTTSTSFVDVTGMSVTITPNKSDSAVMLIASFLAANSSSNSNGTQAARFAITDSSNNTISGAQFSEFASNNFTVSGTGVLIHNLVCIGWATPATTSAVTYKLRFLSPGGFSTVQAQNANQTGQMFAIEVAA